MTRDPLIAKSRCRDWLTAIRQYLALTAVLHIVWETLHLPLYTIWSTGTVSDIGFVVIHCTAGDVLIALATLMGALILVGHPQWPDARFARVAALAVAAGIAYTSYSEVQNVYVLKSWAYSDWMPVMTVFDTQIGVSPLLQWTILPILALTVIARRRNKEPRTVDRSSNLD